ncbi:MAG: ATP-binding cassette domain-containing protein [Planctomycetes bacterium]|nr:ATP-binding cassette domain-containing protein [Planctomycetota bacterium]
MEETIIKLRDVHKSFGSNHVLRGLSFEVKQGKTLAIMGPSGTGKSVVLRHIIGLMRADSGLVEVEGRDMTRLTGKELSSLRKRMGFLFQEGALINWLSVGDNVALPLRENTDMKEAEIKRRVTEKLELVRIPGTWDRMPSQISGGMKKRVGLARALITDPDIVLYDEPNAGLDPEISRSINDLIRDVQQKMRVTSIVVEHRIPCIRTVADEVLFLEGGQALVQIPPSEFFNSDIPRLVQFLGPDASARASALDQ